ncbi:MAG: energy transducer TonB [Pseudomonadota bacterium]
MTGVNRLRFTLVPGLLAALAFASGFSNAAEAEHSIQGVVEPKAIFTSCKRPMYPKEALQSGQTGKSVLEFLISTEGKVLESKVLQTSGYQQLDITARKALSKCTFTVGTRDGKPEEMRTRIRHNWTIK